MYLGNDNSLGVRASGSTWGERYLKRWEKQRARPGSRKWRDINIPRIFQRPVDFKNREASVIGYIKKGTGGYKKGELIHKGGRFVKFGEKPPPRKPTELSKAGPSQQIVKKFRRPAYMRGGRLGQWEAAIPAAAGVVARMFGKGAGEKKAASQARRSGRAQKALALLVPFSDLVDNARWSAIASGFERFMQVGVNGGAMTALIVNGTPYAFAKQAADVILATSPASIIEKRGGQPAWTALQTAIRAAISRRKPDPVALRSPLKPTAQPIVSPYLPGAIPSLPPVMSQPPTPQIITMPGPAIVETGVPEKAGIDPMWLMMGGLGLVAVVMMNK